MRIAIRSLCIATVLLSACGGDTSPLPLVAAPTTPLPTQPSATDLSPVGPTSFVGAPSDSTVLQVRATRGGTPVSGVTVVFQVQSGGGTMKPLITSTDYQGIASAQWNLGSVPGTNLATATGGLATTPISFTVSTLPDSTSAP